MNNAGKKQPPQPLCIDGKMPNYAIPFFLAAFFDATIWWAHVLGEMEGVRTSGVPWELIQLGGTGGLIVCLLCGVVALWRDRRSLVEMLSNERDAHRDQLRDIQQKHDAQVAEANAKLLGEMREQITRLSSKDDT